MAQIKEVETFLDTLQKAVVLDEMVNLCSKLELLVDENPEFPLLDAIIDGFTNKKNGLNVDGTEKEEAKTEDEAQKDLSS